MTTKYVVQTRLLLAWLTLRYLKITQGELNTEKRTIKEIKTTEGIFLKKMRECNAIYTESKLSTGQLAFPEKSPFFPLESRLLNLSPRGGEREGYSHNFQIGLCLPES